MANVKEVTQGEFDKEVLQNTKPVLVDFYAAWCGPCQAMAPILEEASEEIKEKGQIVKVNVDENNELAAEYNVMSIPTMILFENGKVVDSLIGMQSKENIVNKFK